MAFRRPEQEEKGIDLKTEDQCKKKTHTHTHTHIFGNTPSPTQSFKLRLRSIRSTYVVRIIILEAIK